MHRFHGGGSLYFISFIIVIVAGAEPRTLEMHILECRRHSHILGSRELHALIRLAINSVCHDCDLFCCCGIVDLGELDVEFGDWACDKARNNF